MAKKKNSGKRKANTFRIVDTSWAERDRNLREKGRALTDVEIMLADAANEALKVAYFERGHITEEQLNDPEFIVEVRDEDLEYYLGITRDESE